MSIFYAVWMTRIAVSWRMIRRSWPRQRTGRRRFGTGPEDRQKLTAKSVRPPGAEQGCGGRSKLGNGRRKLRRFHRFDFFTGLIFFTAVKPQDRSLFMLRKSIVVNRPQGLEARPIAELVQVASRYESRVYLEHGTRRVNAKSIMGMMSLQASAGETVDVTVEGTDEVTAMKEIEAFLCNGKLNVCAV